MTDQERKEFIALAQDTFDPELWTEDELPLLRAAREKFEREQARERGDLLRPRAERGNPDEEAAGSPVPRGRSR